jgi:3-carboxy-cis,cis-muconate cycloisomerase
VADPGFTTPALEAMFSSSARVRAMVEVEAALAAAQGSHELAHALRVMAPDIATEAEADAVLAEGWIAGTPVVPLLDRLRTNVAPELATQLHVGATTQDIVDTALVLQLRAALAELVLSSAEHAERLAWLVRTYRTTPAMGYTLGQPARPTLLGYRFARWLDAVVTATSRAVGSLESLPVQLAGPVGDGAGLDHDVVRSAAAQLGLVVPALPWHTDRWPVTTSVEAAVGAARAAAKIATDTVLLAQPAIGEVRVRGGGSSAMPDKRNPIDAVHAIAANDACAGVASVVLGARPHELERATGSWHAEWFAVPLVCQTAGAALAAVATSTGSLEVDTARVAAAVGDAGLPDWTTTQTYIDTALGRYEEHLT